MDPLIVAEIWTADEIHCLLLGVAKWGLDFFAIKNDDEFADGLLNKTPLKCGEKWMIIEFVQSGMGVNQLAPMLQNIPVEGPFEIGVIFGGPPECREWTVAQTVALKSAVVLYGTNWEVVKAHNSFSVQPLYRFTAHQMAVKWGFVLDSMPAERAVEILELMLFVQQGGVDALEEEQGPAFFLWNPELPGGLVDAIVGYHPGNALPVDVAEPDVAEPDVAENVHEVPVEPVEVVAVEPEMPGAVGDVGLYVEPSQKRPRID